MMRKNIACLLILILMSFFAKASDIEIWYHMPDAKEVIMVWGINDWKTINPLPPGTFIDNKIMQSPMKKEGDEFVVHISVPPGNVVDYGFQFIKIKGPFNLSFNYYDFNNQPEKKFYHTYSNSNQVIKVNPDLQYIYPQKNISLLYIAGFFCLFFYLAAFIIFIVRNYYLKVPANPLNRKALLIAASFSLLCILFIIRLQISGMIVPFLVKPFSTFPVLFKIAYDDFLYISLLFLIFAFLFFIRKKNQRFVLNAYLVFIFISVIIALLNSKVIQTLGKPFNYQWLYYSDFLKSTDASKAMGANVGWNFIVAGLLIILSIIPLTWTLYHLHIKKSFIIPAAVMLSLAIVFFGKTNPAVSRLRTVNPVFYFVSSLNSSGSLLISGSSLIKESEFEKKNPDSLSAKYADIFKQSKIKNVIVFVLESTPAEYITAFNPKIKATPFLDSIKSDAALFDAIYAHAPATNKSMFSFLCSTYPYLSYKSLTIEKPDINLPSITSALKVYGYRTSFFNSGDNRYQNAEGFLKNRTIDEIQDFRSSPCKNSIFSDDRYSKERLDGIDDSCLSVRFFDWFKKDTANPFFTMMWTFQTHYPYFNSGKQIEYGVNNPSLEKYLNALHRADETLKQLVEGLKKEGIFESTLIVVLGDHGEAFGRHDQTTHAGGIYEENLHIPLLFINHNLFNGERFEFPGGISDIAPSILSILNKPSPKEWQGENLFSVNRRKRVYFFSPYSDYLFGFREGNYKFIFNASENSYALYDLSKDPFETSNIADKQPEYVKEANRHLQAWIQYQGNYMKGLLGGSGN
jgi:lipoteichoic acid synthase